MRSFTTADKFMFETALQLNAVLYITGHTPLIINKGILRHREKFYVHVTVHRINFFITKPTICTNFTNLFWHETLHVSDSSSIRHQEFIHCTFSNGICHTGL